MYNIPLYKDNSARVISNCDRETVFLTLPKKIKKHARKKHIGRKVTKIGGKRGRDNDFTRAKWLLHALKFYRQKTLTFLKN